MNYMIKVNPRDLRRAIARRKQKSAALRAGRANAAARAAQNVPRTMSPPRTIPQEYAPEQDPDADTGPAEDDGGGEGNEEIGADPGNWPGPILQVTLPNGRVVSASLKRSGSLLCAMLMVNKRKWVAAVDVAQLRKEAINRLMGNSDSIGWSFSDLKKAAGKIARKVGVKALAGKIYSVATSGPVKAGLSMIAPQIGLPVAALNKLGNLYGKAKAGSAKAVAAVKKIKSLSDSGNTTAARALTALVMIKADDAASRALGTSRGLIPGTGPGGVYNDHVALLNHAWGFGLGVLAQRTH